METKRFKPGDKVLVIDEGLFEHHPKGSIRTVSHYINEFVYLVEGTDATRGGWYEDHFELVESAPEPKEEPDAPLKLKNGVEESVWVSFVCSAMQSPGLEANGTAVGCIEAADILLAAYRARLQDGKPSAK